MDGTSIAFPASPTMARPQARATIAVVTGSGAATKVRKANSRMIRAARTPMISLSPVLGLESCWPRYPPAETLMPASRAGWAASKTLFASSSSRSPDETFSATAM